MRAIEYAKQEMIEAIELLESATRVVEPDQIAVFMGRAGIAFQRAQKIMEAQFVGFREGVAVAADAEARRTA